MEDTVPMPLGGAESRGFATPARGAALEVEFTGSGSEYFRIWIVNLGLTLVTFGLYYPWAKVRKRRYFYTNTSVDGHGFDFHGDPKKMLRGYLLIGALFTLYSMAGNVSALAALLALAAIVALWPALFRASQQFRMANTSWRGLRFRFVGNLSGAYAAVLPLLLPALLLLLASPDVGDGGRPVGGSPVVMGVVVLAALLLAPWSAWLLKRYQHDHYALGRRQTRLATGAGSFYGVSLKTGGVALVIFVVIAAVTFGVTFPFARAFPPGLLALLPLVLMLGIYFAWFAVIYPYATSRLQNLVWSNTAAAPLLRFESRLEFRPFATLAAKNLLLTLLTLGLYWPFAAVATARMRLEAVSVHLAQGADHFVASAGPATQDATGEAAGDLFGIDVGL